MGIRRTVVRPIYLISQTPYPGVIHIPVLAIGFFTPPIDFSIYTGLIFTSKQAIKSLEHYSDDWKNLPSVCVSEATASAARNSGIKDVEMVQGYGESIPDKLASRGKGGKWLYLRPKVIASEWVEAAHDKGVEVDEAIMYETLCNSEEEFPAIEKNGVLIFTSPSSIECFSKRYTILPSHKVVVIGKTTQNALPLGIKSTLSETTSVESCVEKAREISLY